MLFIGQRRGINFSPLKVVPLIPEDSFPKIMESESYMGGMAYHVYMKKAVKWKRRNDSSFRLLLM